MMWLDRLKRKVGEDAVMEERSRLERQRKHRELKQVRERIAAEEQFQRLVERRVERERRSKQTNDDDVKEVDW